ncbi:MAG: endonuclease [Flavobacterium sp.]|nr:MAG: endonuclease [Flavobacterium sp.]
MSNFDAAFDKVIELVNDFEDNFNHYVRPDYSEAHVRLDFIDKFFIALGWDVRNDNRKNPLHREVVIEKAQRQQQSKAQKRADYAFYLEPDFKNVRFFVEAKKPSRNLKNADDYFQTARYGWNAGVGVSILTDFEEFHIIDCRFKPDINKVFNAHNKTIRFTDFKDRDKFAELYWIFSREAAAAGNIEHYVENLPKPKKGAAQKTLFGGKWQSIDESFLEYIDGIRETLAKAFKKNDNSLTSELLTEAVTRTIDRLVFIRFLEDKLIEPENYVSEFGNRTTAWKDFINTCRTFDAKYNGVVFKKHFIDEQNFTGADDAHFKSICSELSHLNTPYDFNAIPIHILGSIYERFLGKVVVATDKRVKIEEKPEVRKAGGVYYTPKYIVDYIVKNTVGELIKGKKPAEISKLKFADIACGSGSFLIGVLECLIDYHTTYYNEHPEEAVKDKCLNVDGMFVLSIKQKQQILLNNVYGVDLDHQATEVTQLSLYLKMLEDETTATANEMQVLFHEKILPDLSRNIKHGNSLIGSDILDQLEFDFDQERKINPFDFETAFPEVLARNKGFDAIVGNPPYVLGVEDFEKKYFQKKYKLQEGKPDLYRLFIEKALGLVKKGGFMSYIIPQSLLSIPSSKKLRKHILKEGGLRQVISFKGGVFKNVSVNSIIITCKKESQTSSLEIVIDSEPNPSNESLSKALLENVIDLNKNDLLVSDSSEIPLKFNSKKSQIVRKIVAVSKPLSEFCKYTLGMQVYHNTMHSKKQIEDRVYHNVEKKGKTFFPESGGKNVKRYEFVDSFKEFVSYGEWCYNKPNWEFCSEKRILISSIEIEGNNSAFSGINTVL